MGNISVCEQKHNIKSSRKNVDSKKKFNIKRQIPINKASNKQNNRSYEYLLNKKKLYNNYSLPSRIKDFSNSKKIESPFSYKKNNSNKSKILNYSLTTNNYSRNIINNKKTNTSDNTKHITISDEETIDNQNSIDFSSGFKLNNYKHNNITNLKKKFSTNNKIKKRNTSNQMINIINEEKNEEELSKLYSTQNTLINKNNKDLFFFSCDSDSAFKKENKLNNVYYSNLSPQLTINKYYYNRPNNIYKKSSYMSCKSDVISSKNIQPKKSIYRKIKKDKKEINFEKNISHDCMDDLYNNNYYFCGLNTVNKCPSYKNENKIIKKLKMTKKSQEKEIKLLKNKVNSLYNIIINNKLKENLLLYDLQKEKIKNKTIIKKLKNELSKDKNDDNYTQNNIYKKYTNEKQFNNNNSLMIKGNINHIKTDYFLNTDKNEKKNEIINNIIYCKKNKKNSDILKSTKLKKSIPIKINIDLVNKFSERTISIKRTDSNLNTNKSNYDIKKQNKNIFIGFNRNKSDFEEQIDKINDDIKNSNDNDKYNNLVYIPKKSNLSKKFVLFGNKERSKSINNMNNIITKLNNKNMKNENENKNINNDIIIKKDLETLSLNETNFIYESLNKKGEVSMSLNLSPIIKNISKNKIQSIEDSPLYDLFNTKNICDNSNNNNVDIKNFIYKNKLKFDIIDMGNNNNNKKVCLSPQVRNSNKQKNYFYSRNCSHMLNISFIFFEEKIDLILNKNSLFHQIIDEIINKINENKILYKNFSFIHENKCKLIFIYNNIMLDRHTTLEDNKVSHNSKIFIFLDK